MLGQLAERELTIGELATPFSMSFAAASKHVRVLENAGLMTSAIRGRTHLCRLEPAPLATAHEWLRLYERFWTDRWMRWNPCCAQKTTRAKNRKKEGVER